METDGFPIIHVKPSARKVYLLCMCSLSLNLLMKVKNARICM